VPVEELAPTGLDAWALAQFDELSRVVQESFHDYELRTATLKLYDFCNDTLSAIYLAAVKDRLYCDHADSPRRRATQTVLHRLTDGLTRLLAPVLAHTADEAYRALMGVDTKDVETSVHLVEFLPPNGTNVAAEDFDRLMKLRDDALLALEKSRSSEGGIENPLDAGLALPDVRGSISKFDPVDLADLMGVSRVSVDADATDVTVLDLRDEPRCERSWKRDGTVKLRSDGGMLSDRDARAVGVA
jgi:isoleucyl-tRNA synthetase